MEKDTQINNVTLGSMNVKTLGVLAILGASLMWAIEPVLAKLSYRTADFLETSAIRAVVAASVSLIYALLRKNGNLKVSRTEFSTALYVAIAGTLIADLFYFYALTKAAVINAVVIGHLQPIFIVLLGFLVLKEDKLARFDYLGIAIMVVAGLLVTARTVSNLGALKLGGSSDLLLLAATVFWATTAIAARKYASRTHAGVLAFYRFSIASIFFLVYLFWTRSIAVSSAYQVLVGIAVGIGTILYYEGLKRIKAAQVSALELSTPFFAVVFGLLVLREGVTIVQILGMMLLVAGVHFLSRREEAHS